ETTLASNAGQTGGEIAETVGVRTRKVERTTERMIEHNSMQLAPTIIGLVHRAGERGGESIAGQHLQPFDQGLEQHMIARSRSIRSTCRGEERQTRRAFAAERRIVVEHELEASLRV